MNTKVEKKQKGVDKVSIIISMIIIGIIIAYVLIDPVRGKDTFVMVRDFLNAQLGSGFLWMGLACVAICGFLVVSKFGQIKLGAKQPKYSTFTWCAMMFCACMGASLQFWSVIEWSYYYQLSPLGLAEPLSTKAAEVGLSYAFFHWGVTPWAFYAVGTVAMAYIYYVRKVEGLRCSNICIGVLGEKHTNGIPGKAIDLIFILAIVLGLACTFGTGVYMVSSGWANILHLENSVGLSITIIFTIALIFVTSSYLGLDKGMARVADVNTYYAIIFVVFLFIVGPFKFILNSTTNSLGFVINHFVEMSLWTDPIDQCLFPEYWTMFFWAFWIGTAPFFWIFTTKISEGRKIKSVVSWMMIAGIAGTLLYFGVISNYAISYQIDGTYDMVYAVNNLGADEAISGFLKVLPGGLLSLISWTVVASLFLATSMDSGAFALASNTSRGLEIGEEPGKGLRLFWCVVLTGLPIGFIMSGAPIDAFKASANISGVPILFVLLFAIITLFKFMYKDFGKMSSDEIMHYFEDLDKDAEDILIRK